MCTAYFIWGTSLWMQSGESVTVFGPIDVKKMEKKLCYTSKAQRGSSFSEILNTFFFFSLSGTCTWAGDSDLSTNTQTHTHLRVISVGETLHFSPFVFANGFQHYGSSWQSTHILVYTEKQFHSSNHKQLIRPLTLRTRTEIPFIFSPKCSV